MELDFSSVEHNEENLLFVNFRSLYDTPSLDFLTDICDVRAPINKNGSVLVSGEC